MTMVETVLTQHMDLWASAIKRKSSAGRGSSKKIELYGIKKLRELILELAVHGLLVPQDPNDEPASELLKKIAAEKAKLVKEGKIKKEKPLPEIDESHTPYHIPKSWAWCWLGNIQNFTNGFAFKSTDLSDSPGIGVIKIGDVYRDKGISEDKMQYIRPDLASSIEEKFLVHPGDMVITMTGDVKIGFNNTPNRYYLNQRVGKIECILASSKYVYLRLVGVAESKIEEASGGVIPNVSTTEINATLVPLPPLPEQHRIVAKVDELMALCDQLEAQTEDSLAAHQTLVETLLNALTQAPVRRDAASASANGRASTSAARTAFDEAWQRIADHFDILFTTEQSIDQLKQTILQLAVMGKLVPQDPRDEPASELLKKIAAEKAKLVKEGKIKKEKPLPPITEEEKPFALPEGWEWVRLGHLGICATGKTPSTQISEFFEGTIPFVGPGQISTSGELLEAEKFLSEEGVSESTEALPGDILMVCIGGSIGKAAITSRRLAFNQQINSIRPIFTTPEFLLSAMSTDSFHSAIINQSTGSATPIINRSKWEELLVPLSPAQEQGRICEKVHELFSLCTQLEKVIECSNATQLDIANSATLLGMSS